MTTADNAETQIVIFSVSIQQEEERSGYGRPMYIMLMKWRGKKSKKSEKGKKIAAKYMKKCYSHVCEFLQTSCCTGSSAAQWSSAPDRTAEWAETLTEVVPFYWLLKSFFDSVVQLKDSLG